MHNEVGQGVSVGLEEFGDGLIHSSLGVSRVGVPGCVHENLKSLDAINCAINSATLILNFKGQQLKGSTVKLFAKIRVGSGL